jgi:hypothetical protein
MNYIQREIPVLDNCHGKFFKSSCCLTNQQEAEGAWGHAVSPKFVSLRKKPSPGKKMWNWPLLFKIE